MFLHRVPGGGLCGACVHGPCPVHGSGGGRDLSCLIQTPSDTVSVGVRSCGSSCVGLGRDPANRDVHLGEDGVGLGIGNLTNDEFSDLGTYVGRFNNLIPSTARINNLGSNLTNAYLDTSPSGPTPEPSEYALPQNSTGTLPHSCSNTPPRPH